VKLQSRLVLVMAVRGAVGIVKVVCEGS